MEYMEKTVKYLKAAMDGEHNAIRKYTKFAEAALTENLPNIAYLFKALVEAEKIHLKNHGNALGQEYTPKDEDFTVGSTIENLNAALSGETYEYKEMYPDFMSAIGKELKQEDAQVAELSFKWAMDVELTHAEILTKAIELVKQGEDFVSNDIWICKVCGNLVIGGKPKDLCPVCKHDPAFYKEVQR